MKGYPRLCASPAARRHLLDAAATTTAPLTTPTRSRGAFLAVTLTDSGSVEMARSLGPDVMRVRGRYLSSDDSGLQLFRDRPWTEAR